MKKLDRRNRILLTMVFFACLSVAVMLVPSGQSTQAQKNGIGQGQVQANQPRPEQPHSLIGSGFTYQGQLKQAGSPANGQYDLQFTLFDSASDGNQVGSTVEAL